MKSNYQLPITNYQLLITNYQLPIHRWATTIILLSLLLLAPVLVLAQAQDPVSPVEAMLVGNQAYEAGNYTEATDVYESIIAAGIRDSAIYYNLGNSYFKQGNLGRAILNYRRAQRLDPRDRDIRANLDIARAQTLDKLEVTDQGPLTNLVKLAEEWLTLDEAAILALSLWLLLAVSVITAILFRRLRQVSLWAIAVLGLFLFIGLISMANRYYNQWAYPTAVIITQEVDVTSGPGTADQYLVEFNLHSGAEVHLLESRPGWRRVTLPGNDFQGWVPEETIEQVTAE
jgi:tetratricopeptide (TPR) repeat protein